MNLDPDLQRILNINAKIYNSQTKRQGKVISVSPELVIVDYGNKARSDTQEYDIEDFSQMLIDDVIVANSRLTMGSKDNFKIKPRQKFSQPVSMSPPIQMDYSHPKTADTPIMTPDVKDIKAEVWTPPLGQPFMKSDLIHNSTPESNPSLEIGYINFSTNNFSAEPKKGYTKVEFRKVVERVTLDLTSEQLEQLRELGIVK